MNVKHQLHQSLRRELSQGVAKWQSGPNALHCHIIIFYIIKRKENSLWAKMDAKTLMSTMKLVQPGTNLRLLMA